MGGSRCFGRMNIIQWHARIIHDNGTVLLDRVFTGGTEDELYWYLHAKIDDELLGSHDSLNISIETVIEEKLPTMVGE